MTDSRIDVDDEKEGDDEPSKTPPSDPGRLGDPAPADDPVPVPPTEPGEIPGSGKPKPA
jgi:hypothetical protein